MLSQARWVTFRSVQIGKKQPVSEHFAPGLTGAWLLQESNGVTILSIL
jgi:hypothetical protein